MSGVDDEELIKRAEQRVGKVLKEKWTVERLIGAGGMAVVYAATHRNKKRAAIKMLHPELSVDADIRGRFLREGYVANSVDHPGAVRVDDDDIAEDGAAFLVMELLEGETIHARAARKGGVLPVTEALSIADQLLDVLVAAHEKGVVHRDLKPDNLFLNRDGQLKVLDFGIARLRETREAASATRTGSLMGTPAFMAPEQARGRWEDVDARTDLWAVGATIFTLVTGHFVHEAETANESLALAITQRAPSIATRVANLHPSVVAFVDRSLEYDRAARFADARDMQNALRDTYAKLESGDPGRAEALSIPDASAAPVPALTPSQTERLEVAAVVTGPTPQNASLTTGRPVAAAASVDTSGPRAKRVSPVLVASVVGALIIGVVVVTGVVTLASRGESAPVSGAAHAATETIVPPEAPGAPPTPIVTPAPADPTRPWSRDAATGVSVNDLPVDTRAPPVSAKVAPGDAPEIGAAPAPGKAAALPGFLKGMARPPTPAVPPVPAPPSTKKPADPFARRK